MVVSFSIDIKMNIFKTTLGRFLLYKSFFSNPINLFRFSSNYLTNLLRIDDKIKPLTATLSLTSKCNNLCKMCYDKELGRTSGDSCDGEEDRPSRICA